MQNLWLLIAGGAFWSANLLGAGVWLGYRLARHRQTACSPDETAAQKEAGRRQNWSPLADALQAGVVQSEAVVEKARRLSALCEGESPVPSPSLVPAIRELTGAVVSLHAQVTSMYTVFASFWRTEPLIEELSSAARGQGVDAADVVGQRLREKCPSGMRFPYPCRQWAAPCLDGRLPESNDFFQVQCHELEKDGIAVYVDWLLPAEKLVISLGSDEGLIFMLARVISEHAQPAHAPGKYLLECRFIQRVAEQDCTWLPLAVGTEADRSTPPAGRR